MRDVVIALLLAAVGILGYITAHQQAQISELRTKWAAFGALELQATCAKQADLFFKKNGWADDDMSWQRNHYNGTLNKCIIEIANVDAKQYDTALKRYVSDAFEGKELGEYIGTVLGDATMCRVTLPSGQEKICHTVKEFEELTKVYMQ